MPEGFRSILFGERDGLPEPAAPDVLADLGLDRVAAAVAGRDAEEVAAVFTLPLPDAAAIDYRHQVFRDLEDAMLRSVVDEYAGGMRRVRAYLDLAGRQTHVAARQRWLLDAAAAYCRLISRLADGLAHVEVRSRGLRGLRDHVAGYVRSDRFTSLAAAVEHVLAVLETIRYTVQIHGGRVSVRAYAGEPDYAELVERTFARFRPDGGGRRPAAVADSGSMDHVEARIAAAVGRLFPSELALLAEFCTRHDAFLDPALERFDREVRFYLAYLDHIRPLIAAGLPFTYPTSGGGWGETRVEEGFELALAGAVAPGSIVRNDFGLRGPERIMIVTGPNQGGKSTFARMVGQLHYLAALGVPVPARRAHLVVTDRVFTHFARREDVATLRGRLDDELMRLRAILDGATDRSLIVLNELLSGAALADAVDLGGRALERIDRAGAAAVWVTFVDELAEHGPTAVSMVAGVDPADASRRTFRIARGPADGRVFALAIAERYGLSHERLRMRITR